MEERKTVKVACSQPGGLVIRLHGRPVEPGGLPLGGQRITLQGPSAGVSGGGSNPNPQLAPATTEVDREFWSAWVDQNKGHNPLFDSGVICEVKEEGDPEPKGESE